MTTIAERIIETKKRLVSYIKAEEYLLEGGQSYSIGNRSVTRADLDSITDMIIRLRSELATLERGNSIMQQRVVPRDF